MRFRSKATFARREKRPLRKYDATIFALLTALLCSGAQGGLYSRSSFTVTGNGTTDSNMVLEGGSLGLAIDPYETVKIFGDSMVAFNRTIPSYYPDVMEGSDSTFDFLWADQFGVNKREYRIGSNLVVALGAAQKVGDLGATDTNICFLHGAQSDNGQLVSYVYKGNLSKSRVRLINGTTEFDLDSSATNLLHVSLCAGIQDTYYVAYADNFQQLKLAKVYSRGNDIHAVDTVTVAVQSALVNIITPSVAADSNGRVLVTWLEGGQAISKDLYFRVYDRSLQPLNNKTLIASNSASRLRIHYYDHAPAVAYSPGKFVVASWDSAGVLLHLVNAIGGTVNRQATRIVSRSLVRFTSVAAHQRYLLVMYNHNNGINGVEGFRYDLTGGEPDLNNGLFISASNPQFIDYNNSRRFSASLNCTFDRIGNFAVTWRDSVGQARCCIFATPPIRHRRGFWTSPVESLSIIAGDSLRFYPPAVTLSSFSSWYVEDSIRMGCAQTEFTPSNRGFLFPAKRRLPRRAPVAAIFSTDWR